MEPQVNDDRDCGLPQTEDVLANEKEEKLITIVVSDFDNNVGTESYYPDNPESTTSTTSLLLQCTESVARQSCYFSALLDSGMVESRSLRIELQHLDPRAVTAVLRYMKDRESEFEGLLWSSFRGWESDDALHLVEVFDYLQIKDSDTIVQALLVLHGADGIRAECIRQGWVSGDVNDGSRVISIPSGRKKQYSRFWVCYILCMNLMPESLVCQGQLEFTAKLEPFAADAGAVCLRRELVDYGLISRKGDGSAYWRPKYTVNMLKKWVVGMPRKMV